MIVKSDIEVSFARQQQIFDTSFKFIERECLKKVERKESHIEVITGVRRCGKSTLLKQINKKQKKYVAYLNFEDPRIYNFQLQDFEKLDEIIPVTTKIYFFDEIQNVPSWEVYVRNLHDSGKKVYITGANASLLSKELGTRLTGRYLSHELFPFSYTEFLTFKKKKASASTISEYMLSGGFPEYLKSGNPEILQLLLKDIVLRDIAVRHGIRNSKTLMSITLFLISNIGKPYSYNGLKKHFKVGSAITVSDYLYWLGDAYLFFYLPRFSWSAKSIAKNPRKVYVIDNGLAQANSLSFTDDIGRLLENAVYLHLRRSRKTLYYFREDGECDFVVFDKNKCLAAIQVTQKIHADNKAREINGLLEAMKYFNLKEGFIITQNEKDKLQVDGKMIWLVPAVEFFAKPYKT